MRSLPSAVFLVFLSVSACSDDQKSAAAPRVQPPADAPGAQAMNPPDSAPQTIPSAGEAVDSPVARTIDIADFIPNPPAGPRPAYDPLLVRVQVLLDRAHFSPGVIDGRDGTNLQIALAAFQQAHGLSGSGRLDDATWQALVAADQGPSVQSYVITEADLAGPFEPQSLGTDYAVLATLKSLAYATPIEALAERFHMDESLLTALNPGADFSVAGTRLLVAAPGRDTLERKVARIEIDKARGVLRAFDSAGVALAVYPATIGSSERPAPAGEWEVRTLAPAPTYTYDPKRLTFGKESLRKGGKILTIAAGPNNPVGSTWIDLSKDTFGIHGTPDPRLVGKRASHGCVRLTNWDAKELGAAVQKGAKVAFLGQEKAG
jgi:lipoprotein-anchoring transpeptidase ErfK/SrfK